MTGIPTPLRGLRARFADFEVDVRAGELLRAGRRLRLPPKPFAVLLALLESPGEVVLRDELRRRLWPDNTVVDFDNNLNSAVNTLREVLADTAESPRYVETLPRRGYRLVAPVEWSRSPATAPAGLDPAPRQARALGLVVTLALLVGVVAFLARRGDPGEGSVPREVDPAAYDAFLRGRRLLDGRAGQSRAEIARYAVAELERATALDPAFAPAWAALSEAWQSVPAPPREWEAPARAAARRALELDPDLGAAHLRLGLLHLYFDYDWEAAGRELDRAVELEPGSSPAHQALAGYLAILGRHDEAAASMRRAMELEPVAVAVTADAGWYRYVARDPRGALVLARRALDLEPGHPGALHYLLLAHTALAEPIPARDAALAYARTRGADPATLAAIATPEDPTAGLTAFHRWSLARHEAEGARGYQAPGVLALDHLALGDKEAALTLLERAYAERSGWLVPFLGVYPAVDPLRGEPRFEELVRRLALP